MEVTLLVVVVPAAPAAALAKLQGELRMCGASGCRVVEKHRGHEAWPVLEGLSRGRKLGPAPPGPFYRLALFDPDTRSEPIALYFIPNGAVTRVDGGTGGVAWVRVSTMPAAVARAARGLRPFPVPRITQVVVGAGRIAKDPSSYLRLFRIPAGREVIRKPARRSKRQWIPVYLFSSRDSPWTDSSSSLAVGRRLDLIMRDGEIVRVPHAFAERIRHGESLR